MKFKFTLNISLQAIITLIALCVIAVLPMGLAAAYSPRFMIDNLNALLASAILFIVLLGVRAYETNCFVYGNCVIHSWIMTALTLVATLIYCWYMIQHARKIQWDAENAKQKLNEGIKTSIENTRILRPSGGLLSTR